MSDTAAYGSLRPTPWKSAIGVLLSVGLVARLAPLFDQGGRLFRQFPTEDGYLMLTIARNIGLGRGMSIAEGTIPTNGTQPLATYLWAACFWLVDGDREAGVALVLALSIAIAVGGALLLYRLGKRVLGDAPDARLVAGFAAALWFASPISVRHSMNALETGLYAATVLLVWWVALSDTEDEGPRPKLARWAGIGALLGVSFWARNDGVLLCVSVGCAHLAGLLPPRAASFGRRVAELATAAAATVTVVAAWPIRNYLSFGHIVPISGQAESMDAHFAENLMLVPPKLFEYATLYLPIPSTLEGETAVVAISALAVLATAALAAYAARLGSERSRSLLVMVGIYGVALSAFYGLWFGAGHFMSRYLFPLAAPAALLLAAGVAHAAQRAHGPRLVAAALSVLAVLALGLNARLYLRGSDHMHFQVVEWVAEHVPDETWVGAIQTGTLGFFHERTINLDGKVNPFALEARRERRVPEYVAEGEIQYLVDWVGIAKWSEFPALAPEFRLVQASEERNLAVLARLGAPERNGNGGGD